MSSRSAFFLISVLLFVFGVTLVVIGARVSRRPARAPAAEMAPAEPVASVRQIMRGIVDPAATVVFEAVSTTITASGVEEKAPQTPDEWDAVANSAAALAESGSLLQMGSRLVDRGEWLTLSRQLTEAAAIALRAAEARDAAGVFDSGEAIYEACDSCHARYQRTQ